MCPPAARNPGRKLAGNLPRHAHARAYGVVPPVPPPRSGGIEYGIGEVADVCRVTGFAVIVPPRFRAIAARSHGAAAPASAPAVIQNRARIGTLNARVSLYSSRMAGSRHPEGPSCDQRCRDERPVYKKRLAAPQVVARPAETLLRDGFSCLNPTRHLLGCEAIPSKVVLPEPVQIEFDHFEESLRVLG